MYHPRYRGTHYESGLTYGRLMKKKGVASLEFAKIPENQFKFGEECILECEKYYPEVLEQIYGVADGLEVERVVIAVWLLCMYCYTKDNWCTTMVFKNEEEIIFARNSDFATVVKRLSESAYYKLDHGYSFIGNSTAFIQMEDGVNEHGLAVGLNFIIPHKIKPGLNAGLLVRYLLERCKNTEEALTVLKSLPISSSQILTLVDREGKMVAIECNCETIDLRYPTSSQSFLVSANDYKLEKMQKYKVLEAADTIYSNERYLTGVHALSNHEYSLLFTKKLLSGSYGFMCQYQHEFGFDTIWSSIYDIKHNKIYRAEGNPSRVQYREDIRLKFK